MTAPDYAALEHLLATVLCPVEGAPPCEECAAAARRIVVNRLAVREVLVAFDRQEHDA